MVCNGATKRPSEKGLLYGNIKDDALYPLLCNSQNTMLPSKKDFPKDRFCAIKFAR